MRLWIVLICVVVSSSLRCVAPASPPLCPRQSKPLIIDSAQSYCPLSFPRISPREVNGDAFERTISSKSGNLYTCVLFYASWCPFSYNARLSFEALSSMFPQIEHLAVEQSSAMPSLFSRYGIRSLPTILIMNGTSRLQHHGSKDVASFINFYTKTTGYEPYIYAENEKDSFITARDGSEIRGKFIMQSLIGLSTREILEKEPYLVFATLFVCLRLAVYVFTRALHHVRGFFESYVPRLNMQIFGETIQIFGRVLHMMDVKRVWTKLKLCKSRNFHQGARSARVWASSLTSVALGESPITRSSL